MGYKEFHRINQLLTLYIQLKREVQEPALTVLPGTPTTAGQRALLPFLVPSNESIGNDVEQVLNIPANTTQTLRVPYLAPQLTIDAVRVTGTGFLVLRVGLWNNAAAGWTYLDAVRVQLARYRSNALLSTDFDTTWNATYGSVFPFSPGTVTDEVINSHVLILKDLEFTWNPGDHLVLDLTFTVRTVAQIGNLRFWMRRGISDSYLMLPVEEG